MTEDSPFKKGTLIKKDARKQPKKPNCPRHDRPMQYMPQDGLWRCKTPGCNITSQPKREATRGRPLQAEGLIEVMLIREGDDRRVVLRSGNNVFMDITDLVSTASVEKSKTKGSPEMLVITLYTQDFTNHIVEIGS